MTIGRDDILRVAQLAQLDVPAADVEALTTQIGRIVDYVRVGVPTVYAVPEAGYEGTDHGRGRETSSNRGLDDRTQQRRIAANQRLQIRPTDKAKFHYRALSRWLPLFTLSLSDTYSVPSVVITLPPAIKTCPPLWRHAGIELDRVHRLIAATLAANPAGVNPN